jgi:hypothetical protein
MKTLAILFISVGLLAGCTSTPAEDFVQGSIRISPPIRTDPIRFAPLNDGGTQPGRFTDAKGRTFDFYIDHRLLTETPGAIYLIAYPGATNSVRVLDQKDFTKKIGALK